MKGMLDSCHIGELKLENCNYEIEKYAEKYRWVAVRELYNISAENPRLNSSDRLFAGQVCSQWLKMNVLTTAAYLRGLKEFLEPADDLSIDIPKIWLYIAENISKFREKKLIFFMFINMLLFFSSSFYSSGAQGQANYTERLEDGSFDDNLAETWWTYAATAIAVSGRRARSSVCA